MRRRSVRAAVGGWQAIALNGESGHVYIELMKDGWDLRVPDWVRGVDRMELLAW